MTVSPNPTSSPVFRISADAPEAGKIEVFITDALGRLVYNQGHTGILAGENQIDINVDEQIKGMGFLTVVLNGKYAATRKLVFE
jgi:hypothetical protein